MIISLIVMISSTCATGYMLTSVHWGGEKVHFALANATLALVALHALGVILVSFEHRENLVKAMSRDGSASCSERACARGERL